MTAPFTGDNVVLTEGAGSGPREQHPIQPPQRVAKCVDLIDLGEKVEQFQGVGPKKLVRKIVLIFQTGQLDSQGRLFELEHEMTVSDGEKANLPKFFGAWRGTPFTPEEIKKGIPLNSYVNTYGVLSLANKPTKTGKNAGLPRTVIYSIFPVMEGVPLPSLPPYTRQAFWEKRREQYALDVATYKASLPPATTPSGTVAAAPPVGTTPDESVARAIAAEEAAQDDIPF